MCELLGRQSCRNLGSRIEYCSGTNWRVRKWSARDTAAHHSRSTLRDDRGGMSLQKSKRKSPHGREKLSTKENNLDWVSKYCKCPGRRPAACEHHCLPGTYKPESAHEGRYTRARLSDAHNTNTHTHTHNAHTFTHTHIHKHAHTAVIIVIIVIIIIIIILIIIIIKLLLLSLIIITYTGFLCACTGFLAGFLGA
jgi:hypothetical protein